MSAAPTPSGPWCAFNKPSRQALKTQLSADQYHITQDNGTERPFDNAYWNHHEPGVYVDVVSGEPLFSSHDKFDSGTGWPSFTKPITPGSVVERQDDTHGMQRVEARSQRADSHLGHVFPDGPPETGLRYCINSAALRFIPVSQLKAEGYQELLPLFVPRPGASRAAARSASGRAVADDDAPGRGIDRPVPDETLTTPTAKPEEAILAGGCFWGMEEWLRKIPGVLETEVGYSGGTTHDPVYHDITTGRTGHAEAVRVVFDPAMLSYEQLLLEFFRIHDPTTVDRQGNDVGTQYRSAIFYQSPTQLEIAQRVKARVEASGHWKRPVVTQITSASPFYRAEAYHQDYLQRHPHGYTCHFRRPHKF